MRYITLILLLSIHLIFYSCNDYELQKTWISTSWTESKDLPLKDNIENEKLLSELNSLYHEELDYQLIWKFDKHIFKEILFSETHYDGYVEYITGYSYRDDEMLVKNEAGELISFKVEELTNDRLIVSSYDSLAFLEKNRIVFQPLKKLTRNVDKDDLYAFLLNHDFLINEIDTKISFQSHRELGTKIRINNLHNPFGLDQDDNWNLAEVEGELFLAIGSKVIQIKEWNNDKIVGYMYSEKNKEIVIERMDK